jgi:transcriptional/translational regulatory protein YebC/TACO1
VTVGEGTRLRRRRTSTVRQILRRYGLADATVKANPLETDQTVIAGLGSSEAVTRFLDELDGREDVVEVAKIDTTALNAVSVQWRPM